MSNNKKFTMALLCSLACMPIAGAMDKSQDLLSHQGNSTNTQIPAHVGIPLDPTRIAHNAMVSLDKKISLANAAADKYINDIKEIKTENMAEIQEIIEGIRNGTSIMYPSKQFQIVKSVIESGVDVSAFESNINDLLTKVLDDNKFDASDDNYQKTMQFISGLKHDAVNFRKYLNDNAADIASHIKDTSPAKKNVNISFLKLISGYVNEEGAFKDAIDHEGIDFNAKMEEAKKADKDGISVTSVKIGVMNVHDKGDDISSSGSEGEEEDDDDEDNPISMAAMARNMKKSKTESSIKNTVEMKNNIEEPGTEDINEIQENDEMRAKSKGEEGFEAEGDEHHTDDEGEEIDLVRAREQAVMKMTQDISKKLLDGVNGFSDACVIYPSAQLSGITKVLSQNIVDGDDIKQMVLKSMYRYFNPKSSGKITEEQQVSLISAILLLKGGQVIDRNINFYSKSLGDFSNSYTQMIDNMGKDEAVINMSKSLSKLGIKFICINSESGFPMIVVDSSKKTGNTKVYDILKKYIQESSVDALYNEIFSYYQNKMHESIMDGYKDSIQLISKDRNTKNAAFSSVENFNDLHESLNNFSSSLNGMSKLRETNNNLSDLQQLYVDISIPFSYVLNDVLELSDKSILSRENIEGMLYDNDSAIESMRDNKTGFTNIFSKMLSTTNFIDVQQMINNAMEIYKTFGENQEKLTAKDREMEEYKNMQNEEKKKYNDLLKEHNKLKKDADTYKKDAEKYKNKYKESVKSVNFGQESNVLQDSGFDSSFISSFNMPAMRAGSLSRSSRTKKASVEEVSTKKEKGNTMKEINDAMKLKTNEQEIRLKNDQEVKTKQPKLPEKTSKQGGRK